MAGKRSSISGNPFWRVVLDAVIFTLLTVLMFVLFSFGSRSLGTGEVNEAFLVQHANQMVLGLLLVCVIDTLLLSWYIRRSWLAGLALMVTTAVIYYTVKTLLSQLESWYFMPNVTPALLRGFFLMSLPVALVFPPAAVILLGKLRWHDRGRASLVPALHMPFGEWLWKIVVLAAIVYPLLFFGFGYFVAWRNPAVQAFYGGTDTGNFITHMQATLAADPYLYPFEVMRGLIWIAVAVLVVYTLEAKRWQAALYVGLLFALLMNDVHAIPNPLMPDTVRIAHFIETASSNFIWGVVIVLLLLWHPARAPQLRQTPTAGLPQAF